MPPLLCNRMLRRKEAALYLTALGCPVTDQMLMNWAKPNRINKGPPFHQSKWGRVFYRQGDLDDWAQGALVRVG